MRRPSYSTVMGIVGGVVVALVALVLVVTLILVGEMHSQQAKNAALLDEIHSLTLKVKGDEAALATGNATVDKILTEAGQVSSKLLTGQSVSQAEENQIILDLTNLCASVPGCKL